MRTLRISHWLSGFTKRSILRENSVSICDRPFCQSFPSFDATEVTDKTMLDKMTAVLSAEDFASDIFEKLTLYLHSIERETKEIMGVSE